MLRTAATLTLKALKLTALLLSALFGLLVAAVTTTVFVVVFVKDRFVQEWEKEEAADARARVDAARARLAAARYPTSRQGGTSYPRF